MAVDPLDIPTEEEINKTVAKVIHEHTGTVDHVWLEPEPYDFNEIEDIQKAREKKTVFQSLKDTFIGKPKEVKKEVQEEDKVPEEKEEQQPVPQHEHSGIVYHKFINGDVQKTVVKNTVETDTGTVEVSKEIPSEDETQYITSRNDFQRPVTEGYEQPPEVIEVKPKYRQLLGRDVLKIWAQIYREYEDDHTMTVGEMNDIFLQRLRKNKLIR